MTIIIVIFLRATLTITSLSTMPLFIILCFQLCQTLTLWFNHSMKISWFGKSLLLNICPALIPMCVCLSVCLFVGRSVLQNLQQQQKITKPCKTLQNFTKRYKMLQMLQNIEIRSFCTPHSLSLMKTFKEASAVCRSFLEGVVIS